MRGATCVGRLQYAAVAACAAVLFGTAPAGHAGEVSVFAAASLTDALREIGQAHAAAGQPVSFNFGASSDLARQIAAGAPADVFVSADPEQMDRVERAGAVRAAERVELLSNTLVVVVPADAATAPATPQALAGVRRLALADPELVPAGVYARRWLAGLGLWERLRGRVVPALDVRAALAAVEAGHADAAVVYRTDAALSRRVRTAFAVPHEDGPRITYVAAPVAHARQPAQAAAFVARLRAPESARVFERFGFVVLGAR